MSHFETSRIFINSQTDRQPGESQSNFRALLPKPVNFVNKVSVIGATIPYVFPSFNSTNNTLLLNYTFIRTITIPTDRNFDGTSLASFLQTAINAQVGAGVFTVTFDLYTGFLTFNAPSTFAFSLSSTCLNKIGVSSTNLISSLVGSSYQLVGDLPVNTLSTQNIYVLSSIVGAQGLNANEIKKRYNILYRIPVNVSYFGLMSAQSNMIEASYTVANPALEQLDFQLVDDNWNFLTLPDNLYWTIELKLEHHT
jgi:hypothetical protein